MFITHDTINFSGIRYFNLHFYVMKKPAYAGFLNYD
jgi:hypothetical protein